MIDSIQSAGDHGRQGQIRIDIRAWKPVFHRRCRIVCYAPDHRRTIIWSQTLVGVDVGRVEEGEIVERGEEPCDERVVQPGALAVVPERRGATVRLQR